MNGFMIGNFTGVMWVAITMIGFGVTVRFHYDYFLLKQVWGFLIFLTRDLEVVLFIFGIPLPLLLFSVIIVLSSSKDKTSMFSILSLLYYSFVSYMSSHWSSSSLSLVLLRVLVYWLSEDAWVLVSWIICVEVSSSFWIAFLVGMFLFKFFFLFVLSTEWMKSLVLSWFWSVLLFTGRVGSAFIYLLVSDGWFLHRCLNCFHHTFVWCLCLFRNHFLYPFNHVLVWCLDLFSYHFLYTFDYCCLGIFQCIVDRIADYLLLFLVTLFHFFFHLLVIVFY